MVLPPFLTVILFCGSAAKLFGTLPISLRFIAKEPKPNYKHRHQKRQAAPKHLRSLYNSIKSGRKLNNIMCVIVFFSPAHTFGMLWKKSYNNIILNSQCHSNKKIILRQHCLANYFFYWAVTNTANASPKSIQHPLPFSIWSRCP